MTPTPEQLKARREAHEASLPNTRMLSPQQLAARWGISVTSVKSIPETELRYKEFGQGKTLKRRRYREDWVQAYEEATGRESVEHAA